MWTVENRAKYNRDHLRYPSDLTDDEGAQIEPFIPPAKKGGNKRRVDVRAVVNGVMYILSTGCPWRSIPRDLPPRSPVHDYFSLWGWDGTLDRTHHALSVKGREKAEREASPTACILDSQSVKSAEKGGPASTRPGSTRASGSRARSGLSWSIRKACSCTVSSLPPTCRIVTAASLCWPLCSACSRSSKNCLPTAPMTGRSFTAHWPRSCPTSKPKSSNAPTGSRGSSSCPGDGWSSAPWPGSTAAAGSPRIGKISTATRSPSSNSPPSASC